MPRKKSEKVKTSKKPAKFDGFVPPLTNGGSEVATLDPLDVRRDERIETLKQMLISGNDLQVALKALRIMPKTLKSWIEKDPELEADLEAAIAEGEIRMVSEIRAAGSAGNWKATAHILAQTYPERWNRKPSGEEKDSRQQVVKSYGSNVDLERI